MQCDARGCSSPGHADDDDVRDVGALEDAGELGQPVGRGDQEPRTAVVEDVGDLRGLEHVIDGDEDATRHGYAENGDDRFDTLLEVDRDPLPA